VENSQIILKAKYLSYFNKRFPKIDLESLISDQMLSPTTIHLPKKVLQDACHFVKSIYRLRQSSDYKRNLHLSEKQFEFAQFDPGNNAILMSYDFHLDPAGQLKLIEVNTNASFLALGDALYETWEISQPVQDFKMDELHDNILEELDLFGTPNPRPEVAIVDENPSGQRLFAEFLVYQEWMNEWGFQASIRDVENLSGTEDFIYNRSTDFYLANPKSKKMLQMYLEKKVCLSPNPHEYLLMADKERLVEWSLQNHSALQAFLPKARILNASNMEEIWSERKKLFFKPLRSFGAKQSFKGASISRRLFEELLGGEMLAQEYVAAPEIAMEFMGQELKLKYDLRFYAYKDRVQSVMARTYQGQVTNMKTVGGGFAPVVFT
jgi:hypothetical protein